jgi:hypothetical protein
VAISAPANNSKLDLFAPITFSGTASDLEDGDLSASLTWSSDLDGVIGSGASFTTTTLSEGRHRITASVSDSGGLADSAVLSRVEVKANGNPPANASPVVTITAPTDGTVLPTGATIAFAGNATDAEDGLLTIGLAWSSNIDGAIGAGGGFSATLSDGVHTITASVNDSGGRNGSDSVSITVGNPPPQTDTVTIDKAQWDSRNGEMSIEGTASNGAAVLTATFGTRTEAVFNDAGRFRVTIIGVAANPGTVTVTSNGGGSDTAAVSTK